MTRDPGRLGPRKRALTRTLVGAGVVALLVLISARWWSTTEASGTTPAGGTRAESVQVTEAVPARRAGPPRPERPTAARLPDGAVVPVRAVSTRADGTLDVPDDIRTAGWWQGGSRLGDPLGSTLLAAHVDSTAQGLGPYAALLHVRRGQRILLSSATLQQSFRVTSLRLVRQGALTRHSWIYAASGRRRLTLVTCAPPYDRARGGYQNLAVVTAVPVAAPSPKPH